MNIQLAQNIPDMLDVLEEDAAAALWREGHVMATCPGF